MSESFPALLDETIRFLDGLGFVGFAGVEYAEDTQTGNYVFIELNARPVLPNQLFVDAGVDLTAIAYGEMCGHAQSSAPIQREGVYWLDFHRDLPSSFLSWRRGRLGLREWVRSLLRVSSHASFKARDPKPFLATLAILVATALGRTPGRQSSSLGSVPGAVRQRLSNWRATVTGRGPRP